MMNHGLSMMGQTTPSFPWLLPQYYVYIFKALLIDAMPLLRVNLDVNLSLESAIKTD